MGPLASDNPTWGVLYVSIVAAMDGARFAAVATEEQQCVTQVAAYVAEQAPLQLWPRSARRVQELLAAGNAAAAVTEYFRCVGERWDREWLATTCLRPDSHTGVWSGPVPLPGPDRLGAQERFEHRYERWVGSANLEDEGRSAPITLER